jgi:hypothetical protein
VLLKHFLETMEKIGESGVREYEALFNKGAKQEEIEAFLERGFGYTVFVRGIVDKFKEEAEAGLVTVHDTDKHYAVCRKKKYRIGRMIWLNCSCEKEGLQIGERGFERVPLEPSGAYRRKIRDSREVPSGSSIIRMKTHRMPKASPPLSMKAARSRNSSTSRIPRESRTRYGWPGI